MSDFVNRPGLGTMRANKFKESDNHPDIKGEITLHDGQVVKFAGWKKQDRNGGTYYSLKQDRPREDAAAFRQASPEPVAGGGGGQEAQRETGFDLDDSIPFARNDGLR